MRSTSFMTAGYDFTVADGYDLTRTVNGTPLTIQIRNDDTVARAVLLDVDNPYDDLILGFTGSGSVDQVALLQPGQVFSAPLRVFTQATERAEYSLSLRLENEAGDVDRVPLIIRVQQPRVELDLQVLSVDPRTLVTTARLTNRGDTPTDLALDIVQDATGIPANFVIQPDIQHTYLQAGQTLEIAFIPLDLVDGTAPAALMSTPLSSQPTLAAIPGPYRVTASARRMTIPNVTLRNGTLTNVCPPQTVVAECTTPAGSETRIAADWYCTNKPNIDVPITLALPNGGLNVPITGITVGANFTPGGGALYSHSTTVALNGSLVGSAIVPTTERIQNTLPPQALILGGSSPTQLLSLRSTHTNGGHYTIASGFTVTVEYDEHTRTACFTPQQVADAAGGVLTCNASPVLAVPEQALSLSLLPTDDGQTLPQDADGAYLATQGDSFTLNALVSASGAANITDPVQIELTVPRGIVPQGMTIQGEDPISLGELVQSLICLLQGGTDCGDLLNDILSLVVTPDDVTYTYTTTAPVVIGQPFPIMLQMVGETASDPRILSQLFTIQGSSSVRSNTATFRAFGLEDVSDVQLLTSTDPATASATVDIRVSNTDNTTVCTGRISTEGQQNAIIRSNNGPDRSVFNIVEGDTFAWGTEISLLGFYESPSERWYYLGQRMFNDQLFPLWINASIVSQADMGCDTLPEVDITGTLLPPPPPIPSDECVGLPVDRTPTIIRSAPDRSSTRLGSFTEDEWVYIRGRYTAGTPERFDDWYYVENANRTVTGWASASGTETTPLYDPLCTEMSIFDTPTSTSRPPTADEILRIPTNYPPEAAPFYQLQPNSTRLPVEEFRIPAPFPLLPSSDEMQVELTQGYGLTEFAYLFSGVYTTTNQIHSGLDFFGVNNVIIDGCVDNQGNPSYACISVRAVCDGQIVRLNGSGSATSGGGITIRCDMPDGSASNLFLTYNHLKADMVTAELIERRIGIGEELGLNVYQYTSSDGTLVAPHLHLEAFYGSPARTESLRLNPLLFFATTAPGIELFYTPRTGIPEDDQPFDYYPVDSITDTQQIRAFEWPPYDINDFSNRDYHFSALEEDYATAQEDYDLAIPAAENNEWSIAGETRGSETSSPWNRIPDQNGSAGGLQDISNSHIEWPASERLILSIDDLIAAMRQSAP